MESESEKRAGGVFVLGTVFLSCGVSMRFGADIGLILIGLLMLALTVAMVYQIEEAR